MATEGDSDQRVVVFFDGSREATAAIRRGAELARARGVVLEAVPVMTSDSWSAALARSTEQPLEADERELDLWLEQRLQAALAEVSEDGEVEWRLVRERPRRRLRRGSGFVRVMRRGE